MQKPIAPKGQICPLHQKDVSKVCHTCPWFILVRGADPQTGKELDTWDCAISWMPTLLLETAKQTRGVQAATESFRNEMVKASQESAVQRIMSDPVRILNALSQG